MKLNEIYNEDCFLTMSNMIDGFVDLILTSPPYNTSRQSKYSECSADNCDIRYDSFNDMRTEREYLLWTHDLFVNFDRVLSKNRCVLYNLSYSSWKCHDLMWKVVASIINHTNFTVADRLIWKKNTALPNNSSSNKLTRIVEDVFVFCRKNEFNSFITNKKQTSVTKKGQNKYENIYNFIEARNNDGSCNLNKATFSSELVEKLLNIYSIEGDVVYDPFMGTGTTAKGCVNLNKNYIGSEISKNQCDYAKRRLLK